jgi:putative SOS response-associated peptidase YedK
MCGRVNVKTSLQGVLNAFAFASGGAGVAGMANEFPRWNGAPKQDYPIIIQEPDVAGPVFMRANWGLIPCRTTDPKKLPLLINARCETVATNGYFKFPYANSRALMPIDGFFEWKDIYGTGKNKQAHAIAMADGSPFCLAAIWETWRNPVTREDFRTFAILTCEPNSMMADIHDRMPVILNRADYRRWLDPEEKDPRDLLKPFPAEQMKMWPISSKVGNYRNNTPDILDEVLPDGGTLL